MPDPTLPRQHVVRALRAMLVGPYALEEADSLPEQELLELAPSKHYLTGFLAPAGYTPEDEPDDDALGGGTDDVTDDGAPADPDRQAPRRSRFPSSFGVTVFVARATRTIRARLRYADYVAVDEPVPAEVGEKRRSNRPARPRRRWRRVPRGPFEVELPIDAPELERGTPVGGDARGLRLVVKARAVPSGAGLNPGTRAIAVFLVNGRSEDIEKRDEQFVFQVELELCCDGGFVPRRDYSDVSSEQWDERVADLQFRERREYAVGQSARSTSSRCCLGGPRRGCSLAGSSLVARVDSSGRTKTFRPRLSASRGASSRPAVSPDLLLLP
ncbi:MAG: hypothetical protein JW751_04890 [Polyangiaceae bacterium]|nr:hypothetical protein [Polyangiaceae bacterium]